MAGGRGRGHDLIPLHEEESWSWAQYQIGLLRNNCIVWVMDHAPQNTWNIVFSSRHHGFKMPVHWRVVSRWQLGHERSGNHTIKKRQLRNRPELRTGHWVETWWLSSGIAMPLGKKENILYFATNNRIRTNIALWKNPERNPPTDLSHGLTWHCSRTTYKV